MATDRITGPEAAARRAELEADAVARARRITARAAELDARPVTVTLPYRAWVVLLDLAAQGEHQAWPEVPADSPWHAAAGAVSEAMAAAERDR